MFGSDFNCIGGCASVVDCDGSKIIVCAITHDYIVTGLEGAAVELVDKGALLSRGEVIIGGIDKKCRDAKKREQESFHILKLCGWLINLEWCWLLLVPFALV